MKKYYLIYLLFSIIISKANAQIRDTTSNINTNKDKVEVLFKKAKKQKTVAEILCGVGATLIIIGISNEHNSSIALTGSNNSFDGLMLEITGALVTLSSIPFIIASIKNKSKAHIFLKNENVIFNPLSNSKIQMVYGGVKINL